MPVGHPDSADVRRHFFGRTVMSQSGTMAANEFDGFAVPEANIDDVAIIRLIASPGVCYQVDSYGVSGDIAETWKLGVIADGVSNWSSARRLVVQPMGGGIDVLVQDTTGVAGKTYNFQVDTYIGADQNQMAIHHESQNIVNQTVANGGNTTRLVFPSAQAFDVFAYSAESNVGNCTFRYFVWDNGNGTAGTIQQQVQPASGLTAGQASAATVPSVGMSVGFDVINNSGGNATISLSVRGYRIQ